MSWTRGVLPINSVGEEAMPPRIASFVMGGVGVEVEPEAEAEADADADDEARARRGPPTASPRAAATRGVDRGTTGEVSLHGKINDIISMRLRTAISKKLITMRRNGVHVPMRYMALFHHPTGQD